MEGEIQSSDRIEFSAPQEMMVIFHQFGLEQVLRLYRLDGIGAMVYCKEDRGLTVDVPHQDPRGEHRFINVLPRLDFDVLIELLGGEEQAIQFYRDLKGYTGDLKIITLPDGDKTLSLSGGMDLFRALPKAVRATILAAGAALGLWLAEQGIDTSAGRAVKDAVVDVFSTGESDEGISE